MMASKKSFKTELEENGYCIIEDVLNEEEILDTIQLHKQWREQLRRISKTNGGVNDLDNFHANMDPHGIYKYFEAGHQEHAWFIRTNPKVIDIYKELWETDDLVVSFDGSCYIPKEWTKKDTIWTHTDKGPENEDMCVQGFVALTSNKERTLMVYEGSHKLHKEYFRNYSYKNKGNWQLINHDYLELIKDRQRILDVKAGSLVLWDSRTFHQNRFGKPNSEERFVQYVCYLPRHHKLNNNSQQKKRKEYLETRRTTSHYPYPIKVNAKQGRTFGNEDLFIDYDLLPEPNNDRFSKVIQELI